MLALFLSTLSLLKMLYSLYIVCLSPEWRSYGDLYVLSAYSVFCLHLKKTYLLYSRCLEKLVVQINEGKMLSRLCMVAYIYIFPAWKTKREFSGSKCLPGLHSEFQTNLDYGMRSYHKTETENCIPDISMGMGQTRRRRRRTTTTTN